MRQVEIGSVHHGLAGPVAARDADSLRAVVGLLAARASRPAGMRAAPVLRLRQFVAGEIDDVLLGMRWRQGEIKTHKAFGKNDERDQQQALDQPAGEDASVGEDSNRGFSSQGLWRASERGTPSGLELFPWRRPFHQQARRLGPLSDRFGNGGNFDHLLRTTFLGDWY